MSLVQISCMTPQHWLTDVTHRCLLVNRECSMVMAQRKTVMISQLNNMNKRCQNCLFSVVPQPTHARHTHFYTNRWWQGLVMKDKIPENCFYIANNKGFLWEILCWSASKFSTSIDVLFLYPTNKCFLFIYIQPVNVFYSFISNQRMFPVFPPLCFL